MAPRIQVKPRLFLATPPIQRTPYICWHCRYASLATATTPAPSIEPAISGAPPIARYPRTQPPSHKPPEFRKSQLHRQYQSLLRSSPLIVIFQHNNLKSTEWMGIRRDSITRYKRWMRTLQRMEIMSTLAMVRKMSVVQTGIFASALRVVEFWDPNFDSKESTVQPPDPKTATSTPLEDTKGEKDDPVFTHGLSRQAWSTAKKDKKLKHGLEPLLSGPLALLTLPSVSPQYLKAALSILSPTKAFPAPRRRTNPGLPRTRSAKWPE